jgi:small subunit ribosomal protein S1
MTEEFDWDSLESKQFNSKNTPTKEQLLKTHTQETIDLYEKSFEKLRTREPFPGEVLTGTVIDKNDRYACVDVNWRENAFIDISKENPDYVKYIQPGYEIDIILQNNSNNNTYPYLGSYSELIKQKLKKEIYDSIGTDVAYPAKVTRLIHGGYFLVIDGIEVFMPGSVAGMNKILDFESLIGETLYVCPINYSKDKNYIVVSHREYLKSQVPGEVAKLSVGESEVGSVTGSSKFGVFVEFSGCLTGLIHKSDLDEEFTEKFENRTIKSGDPISFKIKEIVDDFRIVLTQKEIVQTRSIWDDIDSKYNVPCDVNGKIKKIANFGVFIEIEPKISGLLHKSEIEDMDVFNEGDSVKVKLYKIDKEAKKLFFKV